MQCPPQLSLCLARMHHISNPAKFRRLKQCAVASEVSGLVKKGKPGVLVVEGDKESLATFLAGVRRLRYLDFHHVNTLPLSVDDRTRIAQPRTGLHEVEDMKTLIHALDVIGKKDWFRKEMRMRGGE